MKPPVLAPPKGEAMSMRLVFFVVYLAFTLASGVVANYPGAVPVFAKAGGGTDPNGTPLSPAPAPASVDAGGGYDPDGAR